MKLKDLTFKIHFPRENQKVAWLNWPPKSIKTTRRKLRCCCLFWMARSCLLPIWWNIWKWIAAMSFEARLVRGHIERSAQNTYWFEWKCFWFRCNCCGRHHGHWWNFSSCGGWIKKPRGAKSVEIAKLLRKAKAKKHTLKPKYIGFLKYADPFL